MSTVVFPQVINTKRVPVLLEKIRLTALPQKFTYKYFVQLGFSSSNDRSMIDMLKKLGFLDVRGVPTKHYVQLRDIDAYKLALGMRIKTVYAPLFEINPLACEASDSALQGMFSRLTGDGAVDVARCTATFRILCALAELHASENVPESLQVTPPVQDSVKSTSTPNVVCNININVPGNATAQTYKEIFDGLRSIFKN